MGKERNSSSPVLSEQNAEKDISNAIERNKYVYDRINSWIENSDSKTGTSCALFTGAFGVLTFLAEKCIATTSANTINESWRIPHRISFILSLACMAIAILFYGLSIIPNLKSIIKEGDKKKYPLFFGDVQSYTLGEYERTIKECSDISFNKELIVESWINSRICMKKIKRYRRGVIFSLFAIVFAFFCVAARFLMYM